MTAIDKVFSVSQLNRDMRKCLEGEYGTVRVRGEVSGFMAARSKHWYFTMKDAGAQLRCVMFHGHNKAVRHLENGLEIIAEGRISLYEQRGDLQLNVVKIDTRGALNLAFEELRNRLASEGLFDPAPKQVLPTFPQCIGVITSSQGAVLHDILTTLERRCPLAVVHVFPTQVQGQGTAESLMRAMDAILAHNSQCPADAVIEVVIMGRGGGSMEDLYGFNDEQLAHKVYAFPIPLVSAVGHEVDFTILDFVADVRAPTPTGAAELVSANQTSWYNLFVQERDKALLAMQRRIDWYWRDLDETTRLLRNPTEGLKVFRDALQALDIRAQRAVGYRFSLLRQSLEATTSRLRGSSNLRPGIRSDLQALQQRLHQAMKQKLLITKQNLEVQTKVLHSLSPVRIFEQGYAMLCGADGKPIEAAKNVQVGQSVTAFLASGSLTCTVNDRNLKTNISNKDKT